MNCWHGVRWNSSAPQQLQLTELTVTPSDDFIIRRSWRENVKNHDQVSLAFSSRTPAWALRLAALWLAEQHRGKEAGPHSPSTVLQHKTSLVKQYRFYSRWKYLSDWRAKLATMNWRMFTTVRKADADVIYIYIFKKKTQNNYPINASLNYLMLLNIQPWDIYQGKHILSAVSLSQ